VEKIIYLLRNADGPRLREAAGRLAKAGATGIQVNVADDDVAPAQQWRIESCPPVPDAFVSLWLPTAYSGSREPVDAIVREVGGGDFAAYLVTESCPLENTRFPTAPGGRTPGLAQMALLRKPADQPRDEFLGAWLDDHTRVAIDTQSTFVYVQNLLVRTLVAGAEGAEPFDAIVEECFPAEAMTDVHVFFDAVGDDARLADHTSRMMASTARFLDLSRIDVIPTSRYVFG
jgi:hypothetical protein